MKRYRRMPRYTKGEEIFNAVSHIVGGAFGIIAFVISLIFACKNLDKIGITAVIIYALSLIILYTMSSIYHFLRINKAKKVFRILDHCTIFLLIAGSYTPYCLITLRNSILGIIIFSIEWGITILGIVGNAINMHNKYVKALSQVAYLIIGWIILIAINPLIQNLALNGLILLVAGGILYTIGVIFYALGKKVKYFHSIFHLFVLIGSILHFFSILFYVIGI